MARCDGLPSPAEAAARLPLQEGCTIPVRCLLQLMYSASGYAGTLAAAAVQEVDYEAELILATLMESHSLPQMADGGGQQQQQQQQSFPMGAAAAAAAGGGGAGAADSWLAPGTSGPSHFLPGEQALAQSGGRVPRSTGGWEGARNMQSKHCNGARKGLQSSTCSCCLGPSMPPLLPSRWLQHEAEGGGGASWTAPA